MKNVPDIRFMSFDEEWNEQKAEVIFRQFIEKNRPDLPVLSATQDRGMVTRKAIGYDISHDKRNECTYKHILPGQFVIHLRSFQGGFAHSDIEGIASPAYTVFEFRDKNQHNDIFWKYIFSSKSFIKQLEKITYGIRDGRSISFDEFKEMKFFIPCVEEQHQIASYFRQLDIQISEQEKRIVKLKQLKSACLISMFPQQGETVPRVRFKGFNGEWKKKKLNSFASRITRKNSKLESKLPVTISALNGIIEQTMFFNNIVASSNLSGYYLMKKGEFAYNKSYSCGFPFGAVKRMDRYEMGALSNLYIVFKLEDTVCDDYILYLFETSTWHKEVSMRASEGARNHGLLNIGAEDFLDIDIWVPNDKAEQHQIASYFRNLDIQISEQEKRLEKLKQIKAACLDKMFV